MHGTELVMNALRDAALQLDPRVAPLLDSFGISLAALRRLSRALEGHVAYLAQQAVRAKPPGGPARVRGHGFRAKCVNGEPVGL